MNDNVTISTFQLFRMIPDQETAREYLESRRDEMPQDDCGALLEQLRG